MSEASFDRVISEHLALCERNRRLEHRMPLDQYREQPADGAEASTSSPEAQPEVVSKHSESKEHWLDPDSFWDTTGERPLPEFDWGDE
jgi:hypothetical protein